jgi:hypothetical protein
MVLLNPVTLTSLAKSFITPRRSQSVKQTDTLRIRQLSGPQRQLPRQPDRPLSAPPLGSQRTRSSATRLRTVHTQSLNLRLRVYRTIVAWLTRHPNTK